MPLAFRDARFYRLSLIGAASCCTLAAGAVAEEAYRPITHSAQQTIVLNGHDLSIEQLIEIARHGAKVTVSAEALRRAADSYGLIMEAQHEGVPVYRFNRVPIAGGEATTLSGDPDTPQNIRALAARHDLASDSSTRGPFGGFGEGLKDEDIGRAMLAVDANIVTYEAASAPYIQGIVDLINRGVTPAVHWRGAIGEADFVPIAATLTGHGFAYFNGVRLPAAQALAAAGLKPVQLAGYDEGLGSSSALSAGFAALLVSDARRVLEWHDLIWAMDLDGMNGNVGPLSQPVQSTRPFPWANFAASNLLEMLRGGYLFDAEPRLLQDAESVRATVWRAAGAWAAWAHLRDSTLIQMNSTDHNPTARPDVSPQDSWELATPQLLKFYVKGGKFSNGKHGYVLSNSNWDPYPLADDVEAFAPALGNLLVAVVQRMHRFEDPTFTLTDVSAVLAANPGVAAAGSMGSSGGGGAIVDALWQQFKPLMMPIAPDGVTAENGFGDLDAVPMLKLMRMQQALGVARDILGEDLLNASFWMDIRKLQRPDRRFGPGPEAVWAEFRKTVPFRGGDAPGFETRDAAATNFLDTAAPQRFHRPIAAMPGPALPRSEN